MTQFNITIDLEELLEDISMSNLNEVSKQMLAIILNNVMEEERNQFMGVDEYKRSNLRNDYRNGYYNREYMTSIGKIELKVPRTRSGEFSTRIFEKWQRQDQSLLLALTEMVVNGVSTRKVTNIVEQIVGESVSKSFISNTMKRLDPEIEAFSKRSLTQKEYPFVSVDAMYIKVRENHQVVSKAVYIALGTTSEGFREVLGFQVANEESEMDWREFLRMLKTRGLTQPELITSDSHIGLKKAIRKEFPGTPWQRCTVHFLRNIIQTMPKKNTSEERFLLRQIFHTSTPQHAREAKDRFIQYVADNPRYNKSIEILEEGFEDSIQYSIFPASRQRYIKSTNTLERLNEEVRRRERVVRIFPNIDSAFRLIGAVLLDHHEAYQKSTRHLSGF
ncbi:IS256 family transposase [Nosocomiicoccus sp. HMSC09A07]|uniref:IS256 family transposase n=1 Tax=Nosocomiicoccus sp. HMSC09A07 TaxID=1581145 RepID=UPI0008A25A84|nr:IS256 family transposase [Nosocomiicoccus sp. HMSC09A07]OFS64398.1 transposase [Nosocomiicoccus sp. HMSC09A07]